MKHIRFFRQATVEKLRSSVEENLPWYRNVSGGEIGICDNYAEMSRQVSYPYWEKLNQSTAEKDDVDNVIVVYKALNLSPQQATDERIWAYATHCLAPHYVAQRWQKGHQEANENETNNILTHYFVTGIRGLFRDNAIARLWWMGNIASRCMDYELEQVLKILLRMSDVRSNLLERHGLGMSAEIFSGVVRLLGKSLDARNEDQKKEDENPDIYERKAFRTFMKMLNRRGGRLVLNALSPEQLDSELDDMASQAIERSQKPVTG